MAALDAPLDDNMLGEKLQEYKLEDKQQESLYKLNSIQVGLVESESNTIHVVDCNNIDKILAHVNLYRRGR